LRARRLNLGQCAGIARLTSTKVAEGEEAEYIRRPMRCLYGADADPLGVRSAMSWRFY
jgi:hypothetical protein